MNLDTHVHTRKSNIDTQKLKAKKSKRACLVFVMAQTTKSMQLNDFCKLDMTLSEHPMFSPTNQLWLVFEPHTL